MDSLAPAFELHHLLESITDPSVEFTHTNGDTQWAIPSKHQSTFWFSYCDLVNIGSKVCLLERLTAATPLRATIQLKPDVYVLQQICKAYQDAIAEFYIVELPNLTVVMEGAYTTLQFPYARIEDQAQIRSRVIEILQEQLPETDWNIVISEQRSTVMYGNSDLGPVTHIWGYIPDPTVLVSEISLENAFVPINHTQCQQKHIRVEALNLKSYQFWLPMFLSMEYWPSKLTRRSSKEYPSTTEYWATNASQ